MALTATVKSDCRATHTSTTGGISYSASPAKSYEKTFTSSDITKIYHGSRTTTGETLDLTSGLTDGYGTALVFATVKQILIINNSATQTLTIGGGANPVISELPVVSVGGHVNITSTFTVDGTHKNLKIQASASLTYDVIILGT